jgi:hypothetical protein
LEGQVNHHNVSRHTDCQTAGFAVLWRQYVGLRNEIHRDARRVAGPPEEIIFPRLFSMRISVFLPDDSQLLAW